MALVLARAAGGVALAAWAQVAWGLPVRHAAYARQPRQCVVWLPVRCCAPALAAWVAVRALERPSRVRVALAAQAEPRYRSRAVAAAASVRAQFALPVTEAEQRPIP